MFLSLGFALTTSLNRLIRFYFHVSIRKPKRWANKVNLSWVSEALEWRKSYKILTVKVIFFLPIVEFQRVIFILSVLFAHLCTHTRETWARGNQPNECILNGRWLKCTETSLRHLRSWLFARRHKYVQTWTPVMHFKWEVTWTPGS